MRLLRLIQAYPGGITRADIDAATGGRSWAVGHALAMLRRAGLIRYQDDQAIHTLPAYTLELLEGEVTGAGRASLTQAAATMFYVPDFPNAGGQRQLLRQEIVNTLFLARNELQAALQEKNWDRWRLRLIADAEFGLEILARLPEWGLPILPDISQAVDSARREVADINAIHGFIETGWQDTAAVWEWIWGVLEDIPHGPSSRVSPLRYAAMSRILDRLAYPTGYTGSWDWSPIDRVIATHSPDAVARFRPETEGRDADVWIVREVSGIEQVYKRNEDTRKIAYDLLVSQVGKAMGAPVAPVTRLDDNTVVMPRIPGRAAVRMPADVVARALATPGGRRLALLVLVVGNFDRHQGNLIITPEEEPVGLDWAHSFQPISSDRSHSGSGSAWPWDHDSPPPSRLEILDARRAVEPLEDTAFAEFAPEYRVLMDNFDRLLNGYPRPVVRHLRPARIRRGHWRR
jgi:hypothetical protein